MAKSSKFALKIKDYLHSPERKREYNEQHFSEAASRYDFATRAMSLGRDAAWKTQLVAALPQLPAPVCVDLACGTGDIALLLAEKYPAGRIVGIDLTEPMLALARQRSDSINIEFLRQDMGATDFPDASADIVTGGYAVRNAAELSQAFLEIHRILKPGGCAALLDFSKPPSPWFQQLQYLVLKYWCGLWGLLLHGNPEVHSYISASLKTFPDRKQLRALITETGFAVSLSRQFYFGTLELLILRKQSDGLMTQ
ncbi:MAG: ubiquinone/menaquinone biosynthesis methyltransferase [Desulfuromonadales bacterium]|nr:ubiquinone/menaquinone biosynthesis methyltransferase [Desulfuromonadales bacterium]